MDLPRAAEPTGYVVDDTALSARADVVIVGAGHGGAACAQALRRVGFSGSVLLVGGEPDPPYERPPLTKDYLAGTRSLDRLWLRPASFWAERGIAMRLGCRVATVNPHARSLGLEDGSTVSYGQLVWAAGGAPRRLAAAGPDAHAIRARTDVDRLRAQLPSADALVVVGAGYIGLEAAAVLAGLGKRVTVVESQTRVLARVAGEILGRHVEAWHRAHGVDFRLGVGVRSVERIGDAIRSVTLDGGERLACDLVVAGIGIEPSVAPLLAAGADGVDGVDIDAYCRTTLPSVWAIGDCARHANRHASGARIRLESVQNAQDQAATVAAAIAGEAKPYDALPWFWSTQQDLRLQSAGLTARYDAEVVRGDPGTGSFSVLYGRGGRFVAIDCVNATRDFVDGREILSRPDPGSMERLQDSSTSLKSRALA